MPYDSTFSAGDLFGPRTPFGQMIHSTKYRAPEERFDDYCVRYARAVSDDERGFRRVLRYVREQVLLPAGRQQHSMGRPYQTTAFNCLASETMILTRYGEVPIGELAGQKAVVLDGAGQWTEAEIRSFGEQPIMRLTLTNGNKKQKIRVTPGHDWIVDGERINTAALRRNDRIDFITPPRFEEGKLYRLGVAHGFIYGDGSRNGDGFQVRVCKNKESILPFLQDFPSSNPPSCDGDPVFYFYGSNVWRDLKELPGAGRVLGIRGEQHDYLLGFLRGWLAADGCISDQSEITLCAGPEEEAWLRKFGPIVGFNVTGSTALADETNYGLRNKASRNIRFDRRFLSSADLIRRPERFKTLDDLRWRVSAVEALNETAEVFCAIVPTTHSFALAGGTLSGNCFVGGTIPDSYEGIMDALKWGGMTLRTGGGVGWDFSPLRPMGEPIRGLGHGSFASGPLSFMAVWNVNCQTILTAGHRRGAMMGVLNVEHPDILAFINAKKDGVSLKNFNISVALTDRFMEALECDGLYELRFGDTSFGQVRATDVWAVMMENNWDWAEPGVLFIDRINQRNPLYYCEKIAATNPCFAADTLIVTDKGARRIDSLVGETVNVWDGVAWREINNFRVTGHDQPMLKITMQDGSVLRVTHTHAMILENKSRKQACEVRADDKLLLNDASINSTGEVASVESDGVDELVYCCTVPDTHSVSTAIGITTGQCAEQPLPPWGACLLGSINIVKLLSPSRVGNLGATQTSLHVVDPTASLWNIDLELLDDVVDCAVRAFDTVPDRTVYPLEQQKQEALNKRRMGLGVTGMANAIEIIGHRYGTDEYLAMQDMIMERIALQAYRTSIELAREKGSFPLFDAEKYLAGWFVQNRLPDDIKDGIARYGLRNGLLLSVAPTGTISMAADNISSGIEPPFSLCTTMDIEMPDGKQSFTVNDYAFNFFGVEGKTADQTSAQEHIRVLCSAQRWVDSSVSKTCNVTGQIAGEGPGVTFAEFKDLYLQAYIGGCKGATTFNRNGKRMGVRHDAAETNPVDDGAACFIDPDTGVRSCDA